MLSPSGAVRRSCPIDRKRALLTDQRFVCVYCLVPFGSVVRKKSRLVLTVVHFDHVVPLAYLNANPVNNWVAACNVCNQIKGSKHLGDIESARQHIIIMWEVRKFAVAWLAPVSSEENPERWAVKFGTYLAQLPVRLAGTVVWRNPTRLAVSESKVKP